MPFQTTGEKAQWELIYDHLVRVGIGEVITYDDLTAALGRDFKTNRSVMAKSLAMLERENQRTLVNVRGVGYRVAHPSEHIALVKSDHRVTKRRMSRTVRRAESTDRSMLSVEERDRMDRMEMTLRRQQDLIRRLETRQAKQDEAIREARRQGTSDKAALSEQVGVLARDLTEKMERLGYKLVPTE